MKWYVMSALLSVLAVVHHQWELSRPALLTEAQAAGIWGGEYCPYIEGTDPCDCTPVECKAAGDFCAGQRHEFALRKCVDAGHSQNHNKTCVANPKAASCGVFLRGKKNDDNSCEECRDFGSNCGTSAKDLVFTPCPQEL